MGFWWFRAAPTSSKVWGKDSHRVGPTPGCGAGGLPTTSPADRKEYSRSSRWSLGHLPPRPSWRFQGSSLHHPVSLQKTVSGLPRHPSGTSPFPGPKFYPLGRDSEKSSNSLQELADEQRLRKLSTRGGEESVNLPPSPVAPSPPTRATALLPEELRFRERLAASPRRFTAAGGRVWRDQEMDGPSPLPPLPNRFRCCCCLGSGGDAHLCAQLMLGTASLRPYGHSQGQ